jgi:prevent-host-death family protein
MGSGKGKTMTTLTSTELKQHLGEHLERAQQEPVTISKSGRPYAVIISKDEYERLQALEDQHWGERALEAQMSGNYASHDEALAVLQK